MFVLLLCVQAAVHVLVLSETPPLPPRNVEVDKWNLTWIHAPRDKDVTYTVQSLSFDNDYWEDVPSCTRTSVNSCNVRIIKEKSEHGCVMLRVMAQSHGLTSQPAEACSRYGDSCSPDFRLSARPGSLTVHLSGNHSLAMEYGDHAVHMVYYGKKGESLKEYGYAKSSVTIPQLEEGQRYCAKVQYINFNEPVGLESCIQCEVIPESRKETSSTKYVVTVIAAVLSVAILVGATAYIIIYKLKSIKHWLRTPCRIPDHFLFQPFPEPHVYSPTSCNSEDFDTITVIA